MVWCSCMPLLCMVERIGRRHSEAKRTSRSHCPCLLTTHDQNPWSDHTCRPPVLNNKPTSGDRMGTDREAGGLFRSPEWAECLQWPSVSRCSPWEMTYPWGRGWMTELHPWSGAVSGVSWLIYRWQKWIFILSRWKREDFKINIRGSNYLWSVSCRRQRFHETRG